MALKLRSRPKKVVFEPPICRGRDIPDFGHAFSNYTYFRPCGQTWFSSVRRAQRLECEKTKKKKKEESLVKYKPATMSGGLIKSAVYKNICISIQTKTWWTFMTYPLHIRGTNENNNFYANVKNSNKL